MTDNSNLVTVTNTNGTSGAVLLDTTAFLDSIRTELIGLKLMQKDDAFLSGPEKVEVVGGQEPKITLKTMLNNTTALQVGHTPPNLGRPLTTRPDIVDFKQMNERQKKAVFERCRVYRGLLVTAEGIRHAGMDFCTWNRMPLDDRSDVIQESVSAFTFSKNTQELAKYSIDKTTVSLKTPKGGGDAEYEYEKRNTTTKSTVTEYLLSKFIVRKARITVDPDCIQINDRFENAVRTAVIGNERKIDGYANLLETLNIWGYYLPIQFTLGGMIYATDQTEITDFSHAEIEKQHFKASFDAKVGESGGGASQTHDEGTTTTTTQSKKYQATQLQQIGGLPGVISGTKLDPDDAKKWAQSLDIATTWEAVEYTQILPTLHLIGDGVLVSKCLDLVTRFRTYPQVLERQKVIDMADYRMAIEAMNVNPYA